MTPEWPPTEVTVSCGLAPSVAHIRRAICGVLTGVSADKATLYKYSLQSCSWFELKPGMRVEGKGKAVSLKRVENVFEPPYSLAEGDLICAFEVPPQSVLRDSLLEYNRLEALKSVVTMKTIKTVESAEILKLAETIDGDSQGKGGGTEEKTERKAVEILTATGTAGGPSGTDVGTSVSGGVSGGGSSVSGGGSGVSSVSGGGWVTSPPPLPPGASEVLVTAVSRPEDKYLKGLRQQERIDKKQGGFRGGAGAGGGAYRPMRGTKEIVLSLGGDLDFSDSEEEG